MQRPWQEQAVDSMWFQCDCPSLGDILLATGEIRIAFSGLHSVVTCLSCSTPSIDSGIHVAMMIIFCKACVKALHGNLLKPQSCSPEWHAVDGTLGFSTRSGYPQPHPSSLSPKSWSFQQVPEERSLFDFRAFVPANVAYLSVPTLSHCYICEFEVKFTLLFRSWWHGWLILVPWLSAHGIIIF